MHCLTPKGSSSHEHCLGLSFVASEDKSWSIHESVVPLHLYYVNMLSHGSFSTSVLDGHSFVVHIFLSAWLIGAVNQVLVLSRTTKALDFRWSWSNNVSKFIHETKEQRLEAVETRYYMEHYGTLWNIMEHYGTLWNIMEHYGTLWNIMEHYGTLWNIMEHYGTLWTMEIYGTNLLASFKHLTRFLTGPTLSENCFKDDLHSAEGFFMVHFSLMKSTPWRLAIKSGRLTSISGTHLDDLGWMFED